MSIVKVRASLGIKDYSFLKTKKKRRGEFSSQVFPRGLHVKDGMLAMNVKELLFSHTKGFPSRLSGPDNKWLIVTYIELAELFGSEKRGYTGVEAAFMVSVA